MGSRVEMLNPEGKALYEQLMKELESGSSGIPSVDLPTTPKPDIPATHHVGRPTTTHTTVAPVGKPMTGSKEQIENFITQMVERAFDQERNRMVEQAKQAARLAAEEQPTGDLDKIALAAAQQAITDMFSGIAAKLAKLS